MNFKIVFFIFLISSFVFSQEKEVLEVMENQQSSWNNGNIEGFMDGYWKSEDLVFIGSKGTTYGWEKALSNYKKTYPSKKEMGILEFSNISIKMLGSDYAFVVGKWKLIRGKESSEGVYTLVFQHFPIGWKIISDHTE